MYARYAQASCNDRKVWADELPPVLHPTEPFETLAPFSFPPLHDVVFDVSLALIEWEEVLAKSLV